MAVQWVGYTGERELVESIRENYPDLLEQLSFSSRAADVDTKRSVGPHKIFSAKINRKGRVLFTVTAINDQPYIVFLADDPNHKYNSIYLKDPAKVTTLLAGVSEFEKFPFSPVDETAVIEPLDLAPVITVGGRILELSDAQLRMLDAVSFPLEINGIAGAGKTILLFEMMKQSLIADEHTLFDENGQRLPLVYVCKSKRLADSMSDLVVKDHLQESIRVATYSELFFKECGYTLVKERESKHLEAWMKSRRDENFQIRQADRILQEFSQFADQGELGEIDDDRLWETYQTLDIDRPLCGRETTEINKAKLKKFYIYFKAYYEHTKTQEVEFRVFEAWAEKGKVELESLTLKQIYSEFCIIASWDLGRLSPDERIEKYNNIGRAKRLKEESSIRPLIRLFQTYQRYLKDQGQFDPALRPVKFSNSYGRVFLDEYQEMFPNELRAVSTLPHVNTQIVLAGDMNQASQSSMSTSKLREVLFPNRQIAKLSETFRAPRVVGDLVGFVARVHNSVVDGVLSEADLIEYKVIDDAVSGELVVLDTAAGNIADEISQYKTDLGMTCAVVIKDQLTDSDRRQYLHELGVDLVVLPNEAHGLEFSTVVVYDPLSAIPKEAREFYTAKAEKASVLKSNLPKNQADLVVKERVILYLHELVVALTRTKRRLILVMPQKKYNPKNFEGAFARCVKEIISDAKSSDKIVRASAAMAASAELSDDAEQEGSYLDSLGLLQQLVIEPNGADLSRLFVKLKLMPFERFNNLSPEEQVRYFDLQKEYVKNQNKPFLSPAIGRQGFRQYFSELNEMGMTAQILGLFYTEHDNNHQRPLSVIARIAAYKTTMRDFINGFDSSLYDFFSEIERNGITSEKQSLNAVVDELIRLRDDSKVKNKLTPLTHFLLDHDHALDRLNDAQQQQLAIYLQSLSDADRPEDNATDLLMFLAKTRQTLDFPKDLRFLSLRDDQQWSCFERIVACDLSILDALVERYQQTFLSNIRSPGLLFSDVTMGEVYASVMYVLVSSMLNHGNPQSILIWSEMILADEMMFTGADELVNNLARLPSDNWCQSHMMSNRPLVTRLFSSESARSFLSECDVSPLLKAIPTKAWTICSENPVTNLLKTVLMPLSNEMCDQVQRVLQSVPLEVLNSDATLPWPGKDYAAPVRSWLVGLYADQHIQKVNQVSDHQMELPVQFMRDGKQLVEIDASKNFKIYITDEVQVNMRFDQLVEFDTGRKLFFDCARHQPWLLDTVELDEWADTLPDLSNDQSLLSCLVGYINALEGGVHCPEAQAMIKALDSDVTEQFFNSPDTESVDQERLSDWLIAQRSTWITEQLKNDQFRVDLGESRSPCLFRVNDETVLETRYHQDELIFSVYIAPDLPIEVRFQDLVYHQMSEVILFCVTKAHHGLFSDVADFWSSRHESDYCSNVCTPLGYILDSMIDGCPADEEGKQSYLTMYKSILSHVPSYAWIVVEKDNDGQAETEEVNLADHDKDTMSLQPFLYALFPLNDSEIGYNIIRQYLDELIEVIPIDAWLGSRSYPAPLSILMSVDPILAQRVKNYYQDDHLEVIMPLDEQDRQTYHVYRHYTNDQFINAAQEFLNILSDHKNVIDCLQDPNEKARLNDVHVDTHCNYLKEHDLTRYFNMDLVFPSGEQPRMTTSNFIQYIITLIDYSEREGVIYQSDSLQALIDGVQRETILDQPIDLLQCVFASSRNAQDLYLKFFFTEFKFLEDSYPALLNFINQHELSIDHIQFSDASSLEDLLIYIFSTPEGELPRYGARYLIPMCLTSVVGRQVLVKLWHENQAFREKLSSQDEHLGPECDSIAQFKHILVSRVLADTKPSNAKTSTNFMPNLGVLLSDPDVGSAMSVIDILRLFKNTKLMCVLTDNQAGLDAIGRLSAAVSEQMNDRMILPTFFNHDHEANFIDRLFNSDQGRQLFGCWLDKFKGELMNRFNDKNTLISFHSKTKQTYFSYLVSVVLDKPDSRLPILREWFLQEGIAFWPSLFPEGHFDESVIVDGDDSHEEAGEGVQPDRSYYTAVRKDVAGALARLPKDFWEIGHPDGVFGRAIIPEESAAIFLMSSEASHLVRQWSPDIWQVNCITQQSDDPNEPVVHKPFAACLLDEMNISALVNAEEDIILPEHYDIMITETIVGQPVQRSLVEYAFYKLIMQDMSELDYLKSSDRIIQWFRKLRDHRLLNALRPFQGEISVTPDDGAVPDQSFEQVCVQQTLFFNLCCRYKGWSLMASVLKDELIAWLQSNDQRSPWRLIEGLEAIDWYTPLANVLDNMADAYSIVSSQDALSKIASDCHAMLDILKQTVPDEAWYEHEQRGEGPDGLAAFPIYVLLLEHPEFLASDIGKRLIDEIVPADVWTDPRGYRHQHGTGPVSLLVYLEQLIALEMQRTNVSDDNPGASHGQFNEFLEINDNVSIYLEIQKNIHQKLQSVQVSGASAAASAAALVATASAPLTVESKPGATRRAPTLVVTSRVTTFGSQPSGLSLRKDSVTSNISGTAASKEKPSSPSSGP